MKRLLLLLCITGLAPVLWTTANSETNSECSVVSEQVLRVDARTSTGGRLLHGTERMSPIAETKNANARLLVDGKNANGWTANAPRYDSTKTKDGWHAFVLNEGTSISEIDLLVLNDENTVIHEGVINKNELWKADKIHVVRHWVRIPKGMALTIETGAIVKFCVNTGIQVDGTLTAKKAIFTSITDDADGHDTDMNGSNTCISYGIYDITGNGQKLLTDCDIRYTASLSANTTWKAGQVIHIMNMLIVPSGVTLTIESGAIVKFATGAELKTEGGNIVANGVLFTHLADDSADAGGDTNGDGDATSPVIDAYKLTGFIPPADCELRYMTLTFEGGTISGTTVLRGNCVYKVKDYIWIESGGKLVIQPGTILKMEEGGYILVDVGGTLEAIGNRAQPIVITSIKDDEYGGDSNGDGTATKADLGDWHGLGVFGGTASLSYCTLMYSAPENESGIVQVFDYGRLTMDCCTLAHALYDGAWNWGGWLTMNNCIVTDCGNAVAPYQGTNSFNHCVFYDNSYALMYWSNWSGYPYFTNCIFKNMTSGWIESNGWEDAIDYVGFRYCLFHNDASLAFHDMPYAEDSYPLHNILNEDPLFIDADNWNFQLSSNSPCIDAGDGTAEDLPEYDYYGNPRCWNNRFVTPTGIANADGKVPDIGLCEMGDDMDADLDIVLNWVEGPTTTKGGDKVTIKYQVTNIGTIAASGSHRDNIYLVSKDERIGDRKIFLTSGTYSKSIAPGGSMTYTYNNLGIPYVTPGKWGFAVFVNEERDWFEGRNIENNYLVSEGNCEITLSEFSCTPRIGTATLGSGRSYGFKLTNVPAEGAVLIIRGEGMDVTGQFGYLPETIDKGWKSVNLGNGTVLLTIPPVVGDSDVFIYLENTGSASVSYEVNSLTGPFALFDNGVTTASNSGTVTIPLYGIGLTADMDVYLKRVADRINASSLIMAENGTIYATFDVAGAAVGSWTLYASNENGSGSLEALTLTQALKGPQWWCKMEIPSAIRRGRTVVGTFIYGNSGDTDMDAPYVKIEGETGVNVRLSENDAWGKSIEFMALSATYPVSRLKAGEERRQTFEFIQLNDNSKVKIKYEYVAKKQYEKIYDSRTQDYVMVPTPFPWDTNGKLMRPDWASGEDWNAIQNRLKSAIGLSWNSCFDRMRANADYLAMLGQPTNDFGVLWQLDVREAMAVDNAVSSLASATDLVRRGRGFNITISRDYKTFIKNRNSTGIFGRGWTTPYQGCAVLNEEGNILELQLPGKNKYTFIFEDGIWNSTIFRDKNCLVETDSFFVLTYPDGQMTYFDKKTGYLASYRDINGNGLDFVYNNDGQLIQIIHTDGQWVKLSYNGAYVVKIEDDLGNFVTYKYSGNELVSATAIDGQTTCYDKGMRRIHYPDGTTKDYTFDEMGRVLTISNNGNQQTITIDRGRFGSYSVIAPDGGKTDTIVGASGNVLYVIDPLGNKTTCIYDKVIEAVTSIQTPMGRSVHYEYDKDLNITFSIAPDGTGTRFAFTKDGDLESYKDASGRSTTYIYDDKGQVTGHRMANGLSNELVYNHKGDVISSIDSSGATSTMEYDNEGRLISSTDADGRTISLEYNNKGTIKKINDTFLGSTFFEYSDKKYLKKIINADARGFSYEYDDYGRIVKQIWTDGFEQCYEYDALGRVQKMFDGKGNMLVTLEYDTVTGRLKALLYGNGTSVHYTYNLDGKILAIVHENQNGEKLEFFEYMYNPDGQRIYTTSSSGTEDYDYDLMNQLIDVRYADGKSEKFSYDAVGNRISVNSENYVTNDLNQYLSVGDAVFTYDENGNLATRTDVLGITKYTYDAQSRLVTVTYPDGTKWKCEYDALGNRTKVIDSNGERQFLYTIGGISSLAAEYDASGHLLRRYILLGNTLIADVDSSDNFRYYHADALGSTRLLTDNAGTVIGRQSYDVFGKVHSSFGEITRFGFVGCYGVEQDETGLLFMRHRYYDSNFGRFIQLDPIGVAAGDINWYRYCFNDSIMKIDPLGYAEMTLCQEFAENMNGQPYNIVCDDNLKNPNWGSASYKNNEVRINNNIKEHTLSVAYGIQGRELIKFVYYHEKFHNDKANIKLKEEGVFLNQHVLCEILADLEGYNAIRQTPNWEMIKQRLIKNRTKYENEGVKYGWDKLDDYIERVKQSEGFKTERVAGYFSPSDGSFYIDCEDPNGEENEQSTESKTSIDPNEMVGPLGFGDETTERFVTPGEWLSYTINFENKSSATAAAQEVFVDAQLSEYLDWSTFEIGSVFFSNQTELGLMGKQRGKILVDRQNTNQKVQIEVTMNASTGKVRWYLRSYDPDTTDHWPASVYDGFLPPNDDNHAGEGSLTYRIKVKDDAPHNVRIDAAAEIIFDTNAMIPTDPAWFNTVYAMAPADDFEPSLPDGTAMLQLGSLGWEAVAGAAEYDVTLWKVVDGRDVQVASATGLKMGYWDISGYAEGDTPGTTYRWQIVARNNLGSRTSGVYSFHTLGADEQMAYALRPGWNLVAVPFEIEAEVGGGELLDMSPIVYERLQKAYMRVAESMKAGTAAWLFSRETKSIRIWTDKGPQNGPKLPPELSKGWNLTGICGTQELLVDCEAEGVTAIWTWSNGKFVSVSIENGAALLEPGVGYWLYIMDEGEFPNVVNLEFTPPSGTKFSGERLQIFLKSNLAYDVVTFYYTLDGSTPSDKSNRYDVANGISLTATATVRVAAYVDNKLIRNDFRANYTNVPYTYSIQDGKATITQYTIGKKTEVVIPDRIDGAVVTGIGNRCFAGASSLTSLKLPDSIVSIGEGAFDGCAALTMVESGSRYVHDWMREHMPMVKLTGLQEDDDLYIVVDLSAGPDAASYPVRYTNTAPNLKDDTCRTTELWLRRIPKGTFIMGSPEDELGRNTNETQHEVTLTQDYYIGVFECTQKQWELVMGSNPSGYTGDCRPVEAVSYDNIRGTGLQAGAGWPTYGHTVDATSFMGKLQAKTGLTFDLPTEAQWEYACRAGTTTALNSGKNLTDTVQDAAMGEVGRYQYNRNDEKGGYSEHTTVGSYLPNAWGLYDMHGNVFEWCLDYSNSYYGIDAVEDPLGSNTGSGRKLRGGCWYYNYARSCRSAARDSNDSPSSNSSFIGLRVALHPKEDLYVVVDLSGGPDAASYPVRYTNTAPNLKDDTCRTTELWLRKIPKGTFIMGSPEDEVGRWDGRDMARHEVKLTHDYYIGVFECTQRQWELVMGTRPSYFGNDDYYATRPVEYVSYDMIRGIGEQAGAGWPEFGHSVDVTSFMGKLQARTGLQFDLPTEAQWEYACRAGTITALNNGKNLSSPDYDAVMDDVGRYRYNGGQEDSHDCPTDGGTAKVGSYLPNAWGLYDMHGNVWEWSLDWWGASTTSTTAETDPLGPASGSKRVARGSGWSSYVRYCRSASRSNDNPSNRYANIGFRIYCQSIDR